MINVVVLDFERGVREVVKDKEPREQVATEGKWNAAFEIGIRKSGDRRGFENERKELFRKTGCGLLEGRIYGDLFLGSGDLLV